MPIVGASLKTGCYNLSTRARQILYPPQLMTVSSANMAIKPRSALPVEAVVLALIMALALAVRLIRIEQLPPGMHGDEANGALLGLDMLKTWSFPPYTSVEAGTPAWPMVLLGVAVSVFGRTLFAVRVIQVYAGTLTVLALYGLARKYFDVSTALGAAALLATSEWHIHYSRLGFGLIGWPLLVLIESWAVLKAIELDRRRDWILAGLLTGSGVYLYNAHWLVLALFSGFVLLYAVTRQPRTAALLACGTYYLAIMVAMIPVVLYATDTNHSYLAHFGDSSVMQKPAWQQVDGTHRVLLVVTRYQDWWTHALVRANDRDPIDELGVAPIISILLLPFAAIGIVRGARNQRALTLLGLIMLLCMPLSAALTEGGYARRTFPLLPFLLLFAGAGLRGLMANFGQAQKIRPLVVIAAIAIILLVSIQNLNDYFNQFARVANDEFLFVRDQTAAALWMAKLPSGCFVEFSSTLRSIHYEVPLFLAPNVRGEDNSAEFASGFSPQASAAKGLPVWVLLDSYRSKIDQVRGANPGGSEAIKGDPSNPLFIAYLSSGCSAIAPNVN